jgi:hypothetical protein
MAPRRLQSLIASATRSTGLTVQFKIGEPSFPEAIDARIFPHIGSISTSLAEAKRYSHVVRSQP